MDAAQRFLDELGKVVDTKNVDIALRRLALTGGTIASLAAAAAVLLMPEPRPASERPPERRVVVTERPAILDLPVAADDFATCEVPQKSDDRDAPSIATPARRKASKVPFLDGMQSIILKRKNKPHLKVTVTELADDGTPVKRAENAAQQTYAIDADELSNQGLSTRIKGSDEKDNVQLVIELGSEHSP